MNDNYTDIVFIVDNSGSMQNIAKDMEGTIKSYIDEQKKLESKCLVSLYNFSSSGRMNSPFVAKPVKDIEAVSIFPSGNTALLDAIGDVINQTGARYASMRAEDRPEKIFIIIVTDGHENDSLRFNQNQIKDMVRHQTEKYSWTFMYFGANQDAFTVATNLGISTSNAMLYTSSKDSIDSFSKIAAKKTLVARSANREQYAVMRNSMFDINDQQEQHEVNNGNA